MRAWAVLTNTRRSRIAGLLVSGALLLSAGSVLPAQAAPAGSSTGRLDVALLQQIDSLNPFTGISAPAQQIFGLTYDRLTDYRTTDNVPVPGLAESWQTSPDGRTWTFTIRRGVQWSDGQPLTAADIAFTYTTIMKQPTSVNAALVEAFTAVTAPADDTLVIKTSAPTPTMLSLDIPIVPEHVWRTRDPMGELPAGTGTVGSGPFRLVEARPGEQYRLERRAGHWRGTPGPAEVVLRHYTNSDAAAQALRTGEVDVVGNLTPAQFEALAREPAVATNEARGTRFTHLGFNPGAARADGTPIGDGNPALRDPRVRAAIEQAVDRRTLVDRVLLGHGDPGLAYFPPTYQPWAWTPATPSRPFDPVAAGRLLDEAGLRRGADGRRPLTLRLFAPAERVHYGQSATFIREWLAAIGVTVMVTTMADTKLGQRVRAGRYDMFLGGWILDPDPAFLLSVQTCAARPDAAGNGTTDAFTCNPRWDDLYRRQSHELDTERRVALVRQMQQSLYETAALVPLYYPAVLEAYRRDHFQGLTRRPAASGSLVGAWSYVTATPVVPEAGAPRGHGALAGVGIAVAVLLGAAAFLVHRRRASRHLRE
ncbi:ABC transporter substrate-binding protein [Actinoplanes sp. NPDC048791]|uniref:ABC transporter substrate-binding protein n=1 Tax=Actinoplanes sp. NPDC048791 TaxID=3154623 RepID=UPI0033CD6A5A